MPRGALFRSPAFRIIARVVESFLKKPDTRAFFWNIYAPFVLFPTDYALVFLFLPHVWKSNECRGVSPGSLPLFQTASF